MGAGLESHGLLLENSMKELELHSGQKWTMALCHLPEGSRRQRSEVAVPVGASDGTEMRVKALGGHRSDKMRAWRPGGSALSF